MRNGFRELSTCRDTGFTLMELLVSITLMGLIAVAIHSGFRLSMTSWERSEEALQRQRTLSFVFDLISRQVGSIVPFYSRQQVDGVPIDVLLFQGSARGVRFVSSFSSEGRSAGGLRLVEYFLADSPTGEGKALLSNEDALPDNSALVGRVFTSFSRGEGNYVAAEFAGFVSRPDSAVLIEDLVDLEFQFPRKEKDEEVPPPGSSNLLMAGRQGMLMAFFNRRGRASNKRNQLPLGLRFKLSWREAGFFQTQDLTIAVPIQAGV
ncbi:MAG: prepilin-type N-terminal cleavage/methylation domain-containing protein [Acidimicrobiia bacterium]|nr:prepilin-type N-terminal cleavage/methylation domain-containing protein [Acidimicrobiia bacterium]